MKKRNIIIASMLSMVALGSFTAYEIIKYNYKEEVVQTDKLNLEETDSASDDLFGGNTEIFDAGKISLASNTEDYEILSPVVGKQHYYNDGKLSIRFFVALKNKNVNVTWTRALYNSDGSVNDAFKKGTYTSTKAYSALSYKEGENTKTYLPSEVGEDYHYFAIYTIKNIPSTYSTCIFDARAEISNEYNKEVSKTVSVNTNETASATDIKVDELNTSYVEYKGNSVYFNHTSRILYKSGDDLETTYFKGKIGDNVYDLVSASGYNSAKTGKQTITLDFGRASATYDVYVVDTEAYKDSNNVYTVTVDKAYIGEIGAVDGTNGNMFTTVSQALEFLQDSSRVPTNSNKVLNIGAGYYNEKLEITTPNLTINGAKGTAKGTYLNDVNYNEGKFNESTIIEYDTLYGTPVTNSNIDGGLNTTDSTQTVAIRSTATNCKINNVVLSNKWNCEEYFYSKLDYLSSNGLTKNDKPSEHRGLALLVQADQFVMKNSSLLGYQDTLELMTGRQYLEDCYISGTTDYIFGTNNITLFEGCIIHTIYNGSSTAGGYVTAFKGQHSGNDSPEYGAVFHTCTFEGDIKENHTTTNVALGRPWNNTAKVAFIGCTMNSCISKTAYEDTLTQGARYVAFGYKLKNDDTQYYYKPTDTNVEFVEYGNTGAGALDSAVAGMTMLTESQAAKYYNYSYLYGKTNGNLSFDLEWDPVNGLVDNKTYYFFEGSSSSTGTSYTYDKSTIQNTTSTLGDLTFNTTAYNNCRIYNNGNSACFTTNAKILFEVTAGTSVTVVSYPNYHFFNINDITTTANTFSVYFGSNTNVVIEATDTAYICELIINPNATESDCDASYVATIDNKTYVSFNGAELPNDTGLVYSGSISSKKQNIVAGSYTIEVDATASQAKLEKRSSNDTQMNENTILTFTVSAGTSVTMVSYPNYHNYKISGIAATANTFSVYYDEETSVVIKATAQAYLYTLIINPSAVEGDCDATYVKPVAGKLATVDDLTLSGSTVTWSAVENATSYDIYLDGADSAIANVTTNSYTLTTSGLHIITVIAKASGYTNSDVSTGIYALSTSETKLGAGTTVSFGTSGNFDAYKEAGLVEVSSKFQNSTNGTNNSQVKNGTITFTLAADTKLVIEGNYSVSYTITVGSNDPVEVDKMVNDLTTAEKEFSVADDTIVTINCQTGLNSNYWYNLKVVSA